MKDTDKVIHLNERQNRIMEIMRQQNAVSVATLSSLMKVSEVTIRKDLTLLEEKKMLYRAHGSAILINPYINDRPVNEKEKHNAAEKRAIGIRAASLVTPAALVVWTVTDAMRPGSASGSVISSVKIKLSV